MMLKRAFIAAVVAVAPNSGLLAATQPGPNAIEAYLRPYVATRNFSGVVLVARDGKPVFSQAYGWSDRDRRRANTLHTRFHIASMSMQFTAAAALRLIDVGRLSLDTPVSAILPDYPNGSKITVRHLLTQTSGIADINDLPDYDRVLQTHQTPSSLVDRVKDMPVFRQPGTFDREEHSAFNLLALIIEKKTGLPFAEAVRGLVFKPLGMNDSGIDDDSPKARTETAIGYAPSKVFGVIAADRIHWSGKTGNGSAYSSATDELKWLNGLSGGKFLSAHLQSTMFDLSARVGFGWFKFKSRRFGTPLYSMNGRAPGFASAISYFPEQRLSVIVLSNIYASVPTQIGDDIAAIELGKAYDKPAVLAVRDSIPIRDAVGKFHYGADFYQPNATVSLAMEGPDLGLKWPSGETSYLIPVSKDRFIDRSYWVPVEIIRDPQGRPAQLKYDRFTGDLANN